MNIFNDLKQIFLRTNNYAIKRKINELLNHKSPVIIEAGAHIGSDTIEMTKVWPKGTIHAFEPIPAIYEKLVKNTKKYNNIVTYETALSDKTGTAEIYVSSGNSDGSSSLLSPKEHIAEHPDVLFKSQIRIKTIKLDEWAMQNKITHIDFAWLDMQGFELPVLKASEVMLNTLTAIYTEVSLKEMYEGAALYPEFRSWMQSKGFKVALEDLRWQDMGNVLFIRE